MTDDATQSAVSIEAIWTMWRKRPGNILVPGHDVPMVLENEEVKYLGTREAAIKAWFGEGLDKTTLFELTA